MVELIFNYNQVQTLILANLNDSFNDVIQKYANKAQLDINNAQFFSNGQKISNNEKVKNILNKTEKSINRKIILVLSINSTINNINTNMIKSKDIICPTCKEPCMFYIIDHKIYLYGCKNGHIINNIKLNEFNNTQNIDISKIKCDKCENNKSNIFNNEFYICYKCNMNLCPLCKSIHDKTHSIINYNDKNYICNKHCEKYIKYCKRL